MESVQGNVSSRGNVLNCLLHLSNLLFVEPLVLDTLDDLFGGELIVLDALSSSLGSFSLFLLLLGLVFTLSLSSFTFGFEGLPVDLVHAIVLLSELHILIGELLFGFQSLGSLLLGFVFSFLSHPLLLVESIVLLSELHNLLGLFVLLSLVLEELLLLGPLVLELSVHGLVSLDSLLDGLSSRGGSNDVDEEGTRLFAEEVEASHGEEILDGKAEFAISSDDLVDVVTGSVVGLKSSSYEALLNDAELVVEDANTLFLAATVEIDVGRKHAGVRVSVGDKLVVIGSLLLPKRNELVLVNLDGLGSASVLRVFLDSHSS